SHAPVHIVTEDADLDVLSEAEMKVQMKACVAAQNSGPKCKPRLRMVCSCRYNRALCPPISVRMPSRSERRVFSSCTFGSPNTDSSEFIRVSKLSKKPHIASVPKSGNPNT